MATITRDAEPYLAHFSQLERELEARGASSLLPLRREAMSRFTEQGFPTRQHEEWRYTNVAPISRASFRRASRSAAAAADRNALTALVDRLSPYGCRLVFVNGTFAEQFSTPGALPAGVRVVSLAAARDADQALIESHLARYARFDAQPFVALNTALTEDGAFVHVSRGVIAEQPIHLLFISVATDGPVVSHPRTLIVLDENSQATVIETYVGADPVASAEPPYFTNSVTEIVAAENAVLDHYRVQVENEAAFHIATQQAHQERSSNVTSHAVSFGGGLVRNDINAVLAGEGIESTINGLYIVRGQQHIDNHTAIDHAMPHCNSHELYKGVLDGRSRAVFSGKIFVREDAQKTDAKQTNQNLLLSRDAEIDTKPQLEIFADDVRCTHGATIGQLDEDAVFYLRSRGIGATEARGLLTYAFASDILNRIKVEPLRQQLEAQLFARLPTGALE